jgi:hypothetical protein
MLSIVTAVVGIALNGLGFSFLILLPHNSVHVISSVLNEIKLLKYANKHDHADKYRLLCL